MRRVILLLFTSAVFVAPSASGQEGGTIFLSGGPSIPVGDFKSGHKLGPNIVLGFTVPVYQSMHIAFEGYVSAHKSSDEATSALSELAGDGVDGKMRGLTIAAKYLSAPAQVMMSGFGGIGVARVEQRVPLAEYLLSDSFEEVKTDNALTIVVGAGMIIPVSDSIGISVDARYHHAFTDFGANTQWIPLNAGIVYSF